VTADGSGVAFRRKRKAFWQYEVSAMTKAAKKKQPAANRAPDQAKQKGGAVLAAKGAKKVVDQAPQQKQQAAVANGMFLYTDDTWSQRYFDPNDLHFKERVVFG
jgi:hypothetical protein